MSTSHTLIDLVEEISTSIDKKKHTLDDLIHWFKKQIDTKNNSILIDQKKFYGDRGIAENGLKVTYKTERIIL